MTDNSRRAERIATSVQWAAAHRLVTVIGLPLALAALSWLVLRVEGMDAALAERDGAIALVAQKNVDQDRRIGDLEVWRYNFPVQHR